MTNTLANDKAGLRRVFLERRDKMPCEVWQASNKRLQQNVLSFLRESSFKKFFLFYGFGNEPNLFQPEFCKALRELGEIYLPVIDMAAVSMEFYRFDHGDAVAKNRYGIVEPVVGSKTSVAPDAETIVFVPALAVDEQGNRLGFGKGYYDRYLAAYKSSYTSALIFKNFLTSKLPTNSFDIPVKKIITD